MPSIFFQFPAYKSYITLILQHIYEFHTTLYCLHTYYLFYHRSLLYEFRLNFYSLVHDIYTLSQAVYGSQTYNNYLEWRTEAGEEGVADILVGEESAGGVYLPVDAEGFVCYGDTPIGFRMIVIVALVLEDCHVAQHCEAVGKSSGHEELEVIILAEFYCHMFAVGW